MYNKVIVDNLDDKNRVVLSQDRDVAFSDYINASVINVSQMNSNK